MRLASTDSGKALGEWAAEHVTLVLNTALFANGSHFAHDEIEIYGKTYDRNVHTYKQTKTPYFTYMWGSLRLVLTS